MTLMEFGLPPTTLDRIRKILGEEPAIEKALIYGSRAKGTHKPGSDIDLTLIGDSLTLDLLGRVKTRLHDSPIPYIVDLSIYELIDHEGLREHISRVGQTFYSAQDK